MQKLIFPFVFFLSFLMLNEGMAQKTKLQPKNNKTTQNLSQKGAPLAVLNPTTLQYVEGERCEYQYNGNWFRGVIQKINSDGSYHVSRDGYSTSYNKDVEKSQLRPLTPIQGVPYIQLKRDNGPYKVMGNLKNGKKIDLEWAENSSVACFPGTRFKEFMGNHKFYWMDLPKNSQVFIRVKSMNNERINVYAYSGFDGETLPPHLSRCVSCEAGYQSWNPTNPPADFTVADGPQKVQLRAVTKPYRVLIAVAGADGVTEGRYRMRIEIKPYP